MSQRHRRAPITKDTWLEFSVPLKRDPLSKSTFCGLCGNHGKIRLSGIHTPAGYELAPVDAYCICPNGRTWKYQEAQINKRKQKADPQ